MTSKMIPFEQSLLPQNDLLIGPRQEHTHESIFNQRASLYLCDEEEKYVFIIIAHFGLGCVSSHLQSTTKVETYVIIPPLN